MKKVFIVFIIIFLIGAALRIGAFYSNIYNMDGGDDEPWSKVKLALTWIDSGWHLPDLNFGPLHTYIIATLWFLDAEHYVFFSRLVSLIFGILFVALYYSALKEIFDVNIALFSAFLLSIYPLHVHLSGVSLAEIPAYFLLFSSLYFLYRFINKRNIFYLVLSAISSNLSCMLRFECWIFILLFTAVLFYKNRSFFYTFIYLALALIFPLIWMFINYEITGNPVNFILVSSNMSRYIMVQTGLMKRIGGFSCILAQTLTLPILILSLFGLALSFALKKKRNIFLFLFSALFFIYNFKSIQGTYCYFMDRYSLILGLLLIPLGGMAGEHIYKLFKAKRLFICISSIMLVIFFSASLNRLDLYRRASKPADGLLDLVSWMSSNVSKDDKALLECGNYIPFIVINSSLRLDQVVEVPSLDFLRNNAYLKEFSKTVRYMPVSRQHSIFKHLAPELKAKGGINVYENDDWSVYRFGK